MIRAAAEAQELFGDDELERAAGPVVVRCGCGMILTLLAFRALPYVGEQLFDEPPERLEMRNCPCGSTRAINTDREGNYIPDGEEGSDHG